MKCNKILVRNNIVVFAKKTYRNSLWSICTIFIQQLFYFLFILNHSLLYLTTTNKQFIQLLLQKTKFISVIQIKKYTTEFFIYLLNMMPKSTAVFQIWTFLPWCIWEIHYKVQLQLGEKKNLCCISKLHFISFFQIYFFLFETKGSYLKTQKIATHIKNIYYLNKNLVYLSVLCIGLYVKGCIRNG